MPKHPRGPKLHETIPQDRLHATKSGRLAPRCPTMTCSTNYPDASTLRGEAHSHQSGYVGASFGYIVGFVFCAALCGFLAGRGADRSLLKSIPAMVAGETGM